MFLEWFKELKNQYFHVRAHRRVTTSGKGSITHTFPARNGNCSRNNVSLRYKESQYLQPILRNSQGKRMRLVKMWERDCISSIIVQRDGRALRKRGINMRIFSISHLYSSFFCLRFKASAFPSPAARYDRSKRSLFFDIPVQTIKASL